MVKAGFGDVEMEVYGSVNKDGWKGLGKSAESNFEEARGEEAQ